MTTATLEPDRPLVPPAGAAATPRASAPRRAAAGVAWSLSSKVAHGAFLIGGNMVLARAMAPAELADFFLGYSVVLISSFVGQLGFNTSVVRFVAAPLGLGETGVARRSLLLSAAAVTASSLVVSAAVGVLLPVAATSLFGSPGVAATAWAFAGWTLLFSLNAFLAEAFRGFGDFRSAGLLSGPLYNLLFFAAVAAMYASGGRPGAGTITLGTALAAALATNVLHLAVAGALLMRTVARRLPGPAALAGAAGAVSAARLLRESLPIMGMWLAMRFAAQLDLWLAGAVGTPDAVARYGAVTRWMWVVGLPMTVANSVLPPFIAEYHARGDVRGLERLLRAAALATTLPAAAVLLVMVAAGPLVLTAVYGPFYAAAAPWAAVLCVGMLVSVFLGAPLEVLLMTGHQSAALVVNVVAAAYLLGAGYAAGAAAGVTGVAWASASGVVLREVLLWAAVRWKLSIRTHCLSPAAAARAARLWYADRRVRSVGTATA